MSIEIVEYSRLFLDHSWKWLNDPEIKKLTNTSDFNREDQSIWFENLKIKSNYLIWGINLNGKPIGACGIKNITEKDCEYWGYIGESQYWGNSYGKEIIRLMECKANELKLESVWLQVIEFNSRAIKLYQNQGYQIVKKENLLLIMRKYL